MSIPWVEKYRPKTLSDIVGNSAMIERFIEFAESGNIPNLIISGPPGCGKTTSVWALARDMLGLQVKEACLELNASDERGIDVVRDRIKRFAATKVTLEPGRHKIVILDEADSMTEGAQQALRRIMEVYSATTRFAFACNQSDKIIGTDSLSDANGIISAFVSHCNLRWSFRGQIHIDRSSEPLQSRCAFVKFGKLTDREMLKRILHICQLEEVEYTDDGLEAILFTAQGDMRQALNNLQCTVSGYGMVTKDAVYKVCDEPHPEKLKVMFEHCVNGQAQEAFDIMNELYQLGYSVDDLMSSMFKLVKQIDVPEVLRLEFIMIVGKCHTLVVQGVATRLQLAGLVAQLSRAQKRLAEEGV